MNYSMNIRTAEAQTLAEQIANAIFSANIDDLVELDNHQSHDKTEVVLTAGYDSEGMPQAELGHVDFVGSWVNADMSWSDAKAMTREGLVAVLEPMIEAGLNADADAATI